jgi:asparagine synthase (glutamine-hydrolysing)
MLAFFTAGELAERVCGIAGIWRRDGTAVDRTEIDRMLAVVEHRGPDGFGAWIGNGFGLGHARLKIVDLSNEANQPMGLADGSLWLSYNGEIHNFIELRAELEALGATFRTASDTEVVLQAFAQWGEGAFERFNGMWALALWEPRRRRLVLARDRFGMKPLFWAADDRRLIFASEAKSILAVSPGERRWSSAAMRDFLRRGWTDVGERTFFENIRMLPPGRVLVVDERGTRETSYWRFEPGFEHPPGGDHSEEFLALLDDAVRIRIRSDVPVGVCLSGGLDSSAVARLVAKHVDRPVQCFSLRYASPQADESEYARKAASGLEHLEINWVEPTGDDLIDTLERIVWHHDAPTVLRGRYPQWHVLRAASEKVTVLLGGQGADEIIAGYLRFILPYVVDRIRFGGLRALPAVLKETKELSASRFKHLLLLLLAALRHRFMPRGLPSEDWASAELKAAHGPVDDRYRFHAWLSRTLPQPYESRLNNALWYELCAAGLPEALRSEDAIGMAFSLESRLPFLDHRLVELCFTLGFDEKIGGGWTKQILRRATRGLLPDAVRLRRQKLGYPGEYNKWFCAPRNVEAIRSILLDGRCIGRGVLDVKRLRRDFGGSRDRATAHIRADVETAWRLVAQELWFRSCIDTRPAAQTV